MPLRFDAPNTPPHAELLSVARLHGRLLLFSPDGSQASLSERAQMEVALEGSLADRAPLKIRMTGPEFGWIRAPFGPRAIFARIDAKGQSLCVVPPVVGDGDLPIGHGRIHASDQVSVLEGRMLHVLGEDMKWRSRELPEGAEINDISLNAAGELWAAGSIQRTGGGEVPREAALWRTRSRDEGWERVPLRLGLFAGTMTALYGGREAFDTIDAVDEPHIATASCAWYMDDPSSFLFVRAGERFRVKRLSRRLAQFVLRPRREQVIVVCAEGDVLSLDEVGRICERIPGDALKHTLQAACPKAPQSAEVIVWNACVKDQRLVIVAGLCAGEGGADACLLSAICERKKARWEILESTAPSEGEAALCDVALLSTD